jgi:hypothetical protein
MEQAETLLHASAKADKLLVSTGLDERMILHRLITEIATMAKPQKMLQRA